MDKNENKKVVIKQNLIEAYKIVYTEFKENLNQMNEMWYGTIRLLITLSTSILLVSVSLVDKILPLNSSPLHIKYALFIGWFLFFLSIIFGILTELKGAEFSGIMAHEREKVLKEYLLKMIDDQLGEQEINLEEGFIKYASLFWGLSAVVTFILGVSFVSIYAIGNICYISLMREMVIVFLIIIIIAGLIVNYFRNRKK